MSTPVSIQDTTKQHTLRMLFNIDKHTLRDVKQQYINEIDNTKRIDSIMLYEGSKVLNGDNKTLRQLGADDDDAEDGLNYFIVTKLRGGAFAPNSFRANANILDRNRSRSLKSTLKRTDKVCCVYQDRKYERTEAPCGHAFTAHSMFDTMKAVVRGSKNKYEILCPICRVEIPFKKAARIANLDKEERAYFTAELGRRALPPIKQCPGCKNDCLRPEGLALFRVSCGGCSGGDWCWQCGGKWLRGGFTVCGNRKCGSYNLNAMLMNCPTKKSDSTYNVELPLFRACPKCATFIMHSDACKHMDCTCGYSFCFVCLKPKVNGSYQCGSHRDQCAPADRQQF